MAEPASRWWQGLIGALVISIGGAALWFLASWRRDFGAHYVAGFGGACLILGVVTLFAGRLDRRVVLALAFVACGLGFWLEIAVFAGGGFDVVDLAIQSTGALLAALLFSRAAPARRLGLLWVVLGLVAVTLGARAVNLV